MIRSSFQQTSAKWTAAVPRYHPWWARTLPEAVYFARFWQNSWLFGTHWAHSSKCRLCWSCLGSFCACLTLSPPWKLVAIVIHCNMNSRVLTHYGCGWSVSLNVLGNGHQNTLSVTRLEARDSCFQCQHVVTIPFPCVALCSYHVLQVPLSSYRYVLISLEHILLILKQENTHRDIYIYLCSPAFWNQNKHCAESDMT